MSKFIGLKLQDGRSMIFNTTYIKSIYTDDGDIIFTYDTKRYVLHKNHELNEVLRALEVRLHLPEEEEDKIDDDTDTAVEGTGYIIRTNQEPIWEGKDND